MKIERIKGHRILRGVVNGGPAVKMKSRPVKVWTILDEALFRDIGPVHLRSAFIESGMHDWEWKKGMLRFYGYSGEPGGLHDLAIEEVGACPYGDSCCPCQDGDPCHYEGENPMTTRMEG